MENKVIKKGSTEWLACVGVMKAADKERKRLKLPRDSVVSVESDQILEYLQSIGRFKMLWLLLTIGDLHPVKMDKLNESVRLKEIIDDDQ